jgi:hypothetical protein
LFKLLILKERKIMGGITAHTFIPNVTSDTGYRTLTGVKNSKVGTLGKFEDSSVSFEKDKITKFLDGLWDTFVKPIREAFTRSSNNNSYGCPAPRERLEDEKQAKKNFSGTMRRGISQSNGEIADIHMGMDGSQYDPRGGPGVTITLKTEHDGNQNNVYAYDFREPNKPYLFAENTSVSELRDITKSNYKFSSVSPQKK